MPSNQTDAPAYSSVQVMLQILGRRGREPYQTHAQVSVSHGGPPAAHSVCAAPVAVRH